jgi:addiction module HigA family antidote
MKRVELVAPHPGTIMRGLITDLELTVTEAAKAIGMQRTHLSAMLSGAKPVTIETAIRFEAAFGGPAPTIIRGMSDLHESTKAMLRRAEIAAGIVRVRPRGEPDDA